VASQSITKQDVRTVDYYPIYLEIVIAIILPVTMLELDLIDFQHRVDIFGICFLIVPTSIIVCRIGYKDMGIRLDNLYRAALVMGGQAAILSAGIITLAHLTGIRLPDSETIGSLPPWSYLLISCPAQQAVVYGFGFARLKQVTDNKRLIGVTMGCLFGVMHVPWGSAALALMMLVAGIWWGMLYVRHTNLIVAIAGHILVGGAVLLVTA
jgi:membrane protease YdiL (CAAX protease family)